MKIIIDTHPFVFWLLDPKKLGKKATEYLKNEATSILVPTIVLLEIQYLIEIKRIEAETSDFLKFINTSQNVSILEFGLESLLESIALTDNRDPFDRIILASATAQGIPIITKDSWMKNNYKNVIW